MFLKRGIRLETDANKIKKAYYDGLSSLAVVKRQASISQMFAPDPVVIEGERAST